MRQVLLDQNRHREEGVIAFVPSWTEFPFSFEGLKMEIPETCKAGIHDFSVLEQKQKVDTEGYAYLSFTELCFFCRAPRIDEVTVD
jgi:hypothetical protein